MSDAIITNLDRDRFTYDTFPASPPEVVQKEFELQPTFRSFQNAFSLLSTKGDVALIISLDVVNVLNENATSAHAVNVVYKWKNSYTLVKYVVDTSGVTLSTHEMAVPFALIQCYLQTFERSLLNNNRDCEIVVDRCTSNVQSDFGLCSSMSFAIAVTLLSPLRSAAHRDIGSLCKELSVKRQTNGVAYNDKLKDYITLMWSLVTDLFVAFVWNPTRKASLRSLTSSAKTSGTPSDFLDSKFRQSFVASLGRQLLTSSKLPQEADHAISAFQNFFQQIRLLE